MRRLFLIMVMTLAGTSLQAEECEVPGLGRGGDWVKIKELERAFRCVIKEIETLKRQQSQIPKLEKQVADLRRRIPVEYQNTNGKVTAEPGRPIGKATITVDSSRSGKTLSLPIAQDVVNELCGGKSCHIIVSMSVTGAFSGTRTEGAVFGPCAFSYDAASGDWVRGAGCGGAAVLGTDGDGVSASESGASNVIMEAGQACLLADTEIKSTPGQGQSGFGPDRTKGLYLIAVPDRRPELKRPFQCVLEIFRTGVN